MRATNGKPGSVLIYGFGPTRNAYATPSGIDYVYCEKNTLVVK